MPVDLQRAQGRNNNVAVLHYEPRRSRGVTIVAAHGYSSSKHNLDALCGFLSSHGFDVFSLDFPGHKLGASGGILRGMEDCVDAMQAVIAHARAAIEQPVILLGHSLGAMTAVFTGALDPDVRAVSAIATGYGRPSALAAMRSAGTMDFRSSYVDGVDLQTLVSDVDQWYERSLPKLQGRPLLFIGASRDAMVSPSSVKALYEKAPEPKSLVTIESDHTFAGEHARGEVLEWLNPLFPRA